MERWTIVRLVTMSVSLGHGEMTRIFWEGVWVLAGVEEHVYCHWDSC